MVERLFAERRPALEAFFRRRIRSKPDAQDLAQEVYLRMLRISDPDAIRSPEAYLFTVAANLVKEQAVLEGHRAAGIDVDQTSLQPELAELPDFAFAVDSPKRVARLRQVLMQLRPRCRAALILHYRDGLSYAEIAEQIGVSTHMVKKYLAQGLAHCRRRMAQLR
jgi:RNA polymerase sigma-70 factor (ECF subfamily)